MKDEVLNGLLTARALFTATRHHCYVRDRHIASAGLTILQDAFELVLYSCLLEVGVDEECAIETSFDQLIGEFRKRNLPIVKSGTLKAMNKQRVLVKHHAQLAEPSAVQHYYQTAALAADHLLNHIIGKPLQHIVIADAITNEDLAGHIRDATVAIEERRYLDAMISCRKALFLAVEADYDVREWADYDPSKLMSLRLFGLGKKAPHFTRNRKWISENVKQPTDYIQLDHERIRVEMLEIGIDPEEFFNVWRLTPKVYFRPEHGWGTEREAEHDAAANEDNARYCLDIVVSIITNQANRNALGRGRPHQRWQARLLRDEPVRTRASADAPLEGTTLISGSIYHARSIVTALDGDGEYVALFDFTATSYWHGFIQCDACIIEPV